MPLVAVTSLRLYQAVADQIGQLIRAGEYRPGDRLPPERDLSRSLNVSRPVVREAMVALEIAGFVEVRGGSGVYVRTAATPARVPDSGVGPYEVFMARRAIEGEIAAAAAEKATEADLAELTAAVGQMRTSAQVHLAVDPGDRRFHLALAAASQNPVFTDVLRFIFDEIGNRGPLWAKLRERRTVRPTRVDEHKKILHAVVARNPDAARRAIHAHLDGAIHDFLALTVSDDAATVPAAQPRVSGGRR